jgi:hypothetical protein
MGFPAIAQDVQMYIVLADDCWIKHVEYCVSMALSCSCAMHLGSMQMLTRWCIK